MLQTWK